MLSFIKIPFFHWIFSFFSLKTVVDSEWKRCWTITNRTITWISYLWIWFCCWHTAAYVCIHEIFICSRWCCIVGVNCIRLWSNSIGLYRCLLSFWWSKSAVAVPAHRTCTFMEWNCILDHVRDFVPDYFISVIKASYSKLNLAWMWWTLNIHLIHLELDMTGILSALRKKNKKQKTFLPLIAIEEYVWVCAYRTKRSWNIPNN